MHVRMHWHDGRREGAVPKMGGGEGPEEMLPARDAHGAATHPLKQIFYLGFCH